METRKTSGIRRAVIALYAVMAFAIGAGIMGIEMTASRMLAPYFGTSMLVWTSLILSVLTACSVGYWIGGNAAAKGATERMVAALLAGSAATTVMGTWIVRAFALSVLDIATFTSVGAALFAGSLIVSLVVFAVPVSLLAVASPIVVKLWSMADNDAGRAAGRYFAVSTIGSMIGTVAPTLVLVPMLGSRGTLYAVALILACVAALALRGIERFAAVGVPALLVLLSLGTAVRAESGVIHTVESPHQLIRVTEGQTGERALIFNEGLGVQSVSIPPSGRTGFYYDHVAAVPALLGERAFDSAGHDVLILGLAAGTAARQYTALLPDDAVVRMVGVEVDSSVVAVAREYFGLDELGMEVVERDARAFLALDDRTFDVIIIDAYAVQLYIPSHLVTDEFFALVRSRVREGGVVVMNVNASGADVPLLSGIMNTLAASFPHVAVVPSALGSWNYLVLASDRELATDRAAQSLTGTRFADLAYAWGTQAYLAPPHNPSGIIFTDDAAPVEFLTENMVLSALRRR